MPRIRLNALLLSAVMLFGVFLELRVSFSPESVSGETSLASSTTGNGQNPVVVGWGGTRLDEVVTYDPGNPSSLVFPGEQASNQEMQVRRLASMGFNAFRVSFQSACSSWQEMGQFSSPWLQRSILIARHFAFWIIIDYHGYDDLTTTARVSCWLGFWNQVVQKFENSYDMIIWEPLNEPTGFGDNVTYLSDQYQSWINQTRSLGDTHWIVVQNLCSYGCGLSNLADGFPSVTDSQGRIFISLHSYMDYGQYSLTWNNATAEALAQTYYQAVLNGSQKTGWPVLNTEGGGDPLVTSCGGSSPSGCPPDDMLPGSAGYSIVTFHFIQTLTSLYDSNLAQRVNWVWWTMGGWTDTPGAGELGTLASNGWGSFIQYKLVTSMPVSGTNVPVLSVPHGEIVSVFSTLNFQVNASGSSSSQNVTLSASNLPVNATFPTVTGNRITGIFSWTPTNNQVGSYSVYFAAADSSNSSRSTAGSVIIQVQGGSSGQDNDQPVLIVPGDATVDAGSTLTFTVSAWDPDPGETVTITALGLPAGATFDPTTGTFSWTPGPGQEGSYVIRFEVKDNGTPPLSDARAVAVQVNGGTGEPCPLCEILSPLGPGSSSMERTLWLLMLGAVLGLAISAMALAAMSKNRPQEDNSRH